TIQLIGAIFLSVICVHLAFAAEPDEKDLRGTWKFRIGDRQEWASPSFDDSDWDQIRVPARWENEGFRGYDGFAWYRKKVYLPTSLANKELVLEMGYVDDIDEVFINGIKIGQSGSFPPNFS